MLTITGTLVFCIASAIALAKGQTAAAQDANVCDPGLRRIPGAAGYQMRGDRCEGLYARPLAATTALEIVSLTYSNQAEPSDPPSPLRLVWSAPDAQHPIHLRIYSLNRQIYYRMDTVRPAGAKTYSWPMDVARNSGLSLKELGFIGWIDDTSGSATALVYLPLTLGPTEAAGEALRVIVISTERLSELYLTLARRDPRNQAATYIENEKPLKLGYYPAEVPIQIPIPNLGGGGSYAIELGATFGQGESVALNESFYAVSR